MVMLAGVMVGIMFACLTFTAIKLALKLIVTRISSKCSADQTNYLTRIGFKLDSGIGRCFNFETVWRFAQLALAGCGEVPTYLELLRFVWNDYESQFN